MDTTAATGPLPGSRASRTYPMHTCWTRGRAGLGQGGRCKFDSSVSGDRSTRRGGAKSSGVPSTPPAAWERTIWSFRVISPKSGRPANTKRSPRSFTIQGSPPNRMTLVPGNHDMYSSADAWRWALEGPLAAFARASAREPGPGKVVEIAGASCSPSTRPFTSRSPVRRAGCPTRRWSRIERRAADPVLAKKPLVVVQHHPPFLRKTSALHWLDGLVGAGRMMAMLARFRHLSGSPRPPAVNRRIARSAAASRAFAAPPRWSTTATRPAWRLRRSRRTTRSRRPRRRLAGPSEATASRARRAARRKRIPGIRPCILLASSGVLGVLAALSRRLERPSHHRIRRFAGDSHEAAAFEEARGPTHCFFIVEAARRDAGGLATWIGLDGARRHLRAGPGANM